MERARGGARSNLFNPAHRRSPVAGVRDERLDPSAAGLQAAPQGALRHRCEPVRRPRRVDQHHAAHPPGERLRGDPPRAQPLGRGDRHLRAAGGCARHRDLVVPGRPRRVLPLHDRPSARARRRPRQGVRRRRRRDRRLRDQGPARLRRDADLLAGGRPEARAAGNDQRNRRGRRRRPREDAADLAGGPAGRRSVPAHARARATHHGARKRRSAAAAARRAHRRGTRGEDSGARHHRHRRRRQELAHRRAGAPLPPRPGRRAAHRHHLHRSVAAQIRWRAARRPDPDERDRPSEHLHALARDARHGHRDLRRATRRDPRVQGRRLRPRRRRDLGHRTGRRRDRAAGGRVAVRDDAGVRRRLAAREDRHARFRRLRRDQQVRPQGRSGRAARRAQAVPAQPRALQTGAGHHARVRHDRLTVQRRRRDGALPGPGGDAGAAWPEAEGGNAAEARASPIERAGRHCPAAALALPRRDRRDGAPLPRPRRRAGAHRAASGSSSRQPRGCWLRMRRRPSTR